MHECACLCVHVHTCVCFVSDYISRRIFVMQLMSVLWVETFVFKDDNIMRKMSKKTPKPPTIASLSILNGVN